MSCPPGKELPELMRVATYDEIMVNRRQWIKALTGGLRRRFRRHTGALANKRYRSFCCLGVACETIPALRVIRTGIGESGEAEYEYLDLTEMSWWDEEDDSIQRERMCGQLSQWQAMQLGLSDKMQMYLIQLNDNRLVPFRVIATIVRELPVETESYFSQDFDSAEFEATNDVVREALEPYREYCVSWG